MSAKLRIRHTGRSEVQGRQNEYDRATITIGRRPENDIAFNGPTAGVVSGRHAEVRLESGKVVIADLGSRNGVYVNGVRVNGTAELKPDDLVSLGETGPEFSVEAVAAPVAAASVAPAPSSRTPSVTADMPASPASPAASPQPPAASTAKPPALDDTPVPGSIKARLGDTPMPGSIKAIPDPRPAAHAAGVAKPVPAMNGTPAPAPSKAAPVPPPPPGRPAAPTAELPYTPTPAAPASQPSSPPAAKEPSPQDIPSPAPGIPADIAEKVQAMRQQREAPKSSVGMHTLMGVLQQEKERNTRRMLIVIVPLAAMLMLAFGLLGVVWWRASHGKQDWPALMADAKQSVYYVISEKGGGMADVGTAFFVTEDTLATNAHVAINVQRALASGAKTYIRSAGEKPFDIALVSAKLHPGYVEVNDAIRRATPIGKQYVPQSYFDVAIIKISREDARQFAGRYRVMTIMPMSELLAIQPATAVATVGFPTAGVRQNFAAPEHFNADGAIARMTDESEKPADDPWLRTKFAYRLGISQGASGSPVFNADGQVIGLISAVSTADRGLSYGPRADLLWELLLDQVGKPEWKKLHEKRLDRID